MRLRTLLLSSALALSASALCASGALAQPSTAPIDVVPTTAVPAPAEPPASSSTAPTPSTNDPSTTVSEVVVTGAPYAVSLNSVTSSVNVVSRQQLDVAAPQGLGDLLNGLPGLRSSANGPGASRPIIRGLSGPRVLILANGVGLVDASSLSPDHAVAADPAESSRIEVLRGPSALAYGGSGIGGVVNVIDDRIPSSAPAGGVSGHASGSVGSVDRSAGGSAAVRVGVGSVVIALDASTQRSGDYDIPVPPVSDRLARAQGLTPLDDRTQRNSGVQVDAYGGGVSLVRDWGFIGVSARRDDSTYGVPYAQIVVQPGDAPPEQVSIHLQQTRYDLRGEVRADLGLFDRARLAIGYADYQHAEVTDEGVGTRFLSQGGEGRLELVQPDRGGWQGAVGGQYLERHFEAIGEEAFVPPTDTREAGLFVIQRYDRGGWGVEGGLRVDRDVRDADLTGRIASASAASFGIDWATAPASRDFTNVSASGAVFVRPRDDLFLSLSVSNNARAPDEFELYADGPHGGTNAFEIGDPTLDTERVTSGEVTIRYTPDRGRAEAHVYYARYSGFIEETPTALFEDDLRVFRFTQTDGTFYGLEFEGSYDVWRDGDRSVSLQGVFDYVHGELDTGAPARIPAYGVTGRLVYADPRLEARLEVRNVGEQDRVEAFELPTDGYTLVNAFASVRPFENRDIRLFIDARNLTDAEAREHTSFLKDIAPQPGRSFRAGFALSF